MKNMARYLSRALPFLGVLVLGILGATPADASHSWGPYHWARTSNSFTLKVVDSMTPLWDPYLVIATTDWSDSTVLDTVIEAGNDDNSTRKKCAAPTGKVRGCNAAYGYNGWLGLAQIWVSGSHIVKGVSKMNDSYFNTTTYNTPAWRQMVVCQEPGHTLGLGHQDEKFDNANLGSCMDYTNDPDGTIKGQLSNKHPNDHDYVQLETIYSSHLESATTSSSGRGNGHGNAPDDLPAGVDEHGLPPWASPAHGDVYEVDLGNGVRLITHVFWVRGDLPGARP